MTGDLDLSTDAARLVGRILASVARGEVERKGARQKRAQQQAAQQGRPAGDDAHWLRARSGRGSRPHARLNTFDEDGCGPPPPNRSNAAGEARTVAVEREARLSFGREGLDQVRDDPRSVIGPRHIRTLPRQKIPLKALRASAPAAPPPPARADPVAPRNVRSAVLCRMQRGAVDAALDRRVRPRARQPAWGDSHTCWWSGRVIDALASTPRTRCSCFTLIGSAFGQGTRLLFGSGPVSHMATGRQLHLRTSLATAETWRRGSRLHARR